MTRPEEMLDVLNCSLSEPAQYPWLYLKDAIPSYLQHLDTFRKFLVFLIGNIHRIGVSKDGLVCKFNTILDNIFQVSFVKPTDTLRTATFLLGRDGELWIAFYGFNLWIAFYESH